MNLCIKCGSRSKLLFRVFAESALTLENCNVCKCKVDKYVEFDFIIIFIDLLLLKVSAYRHVLYNLPNFNKIYLPRLLALTLLSCSYVDFVFDIKHVQPSDADSSSESAMNPIFYELEWKYYLTIVYRITGIAVFTAVYLMFAYLSFLSGMGTNNAIPKQFSVQKIIGGISLSYCWNLALLPCLVWPCLVWNQYSIYRILSEITVMISYNHTFHVCCRPSHFYSITTILGAYTIQMVFMSLLKQ